MVGLAVGDALGGPVEFDPPSQIAGRREELFAMPGGGGFAWAPGEAVEAVSAFLDHSSLAVTTTYLRRLEGQEDTGWAAVAAAIGA